MIVARRSQVVAAGLACVACLRAAQIPAVPYNSQHIVLGRNGQVVPDADPSLYFHPRKTKRAVDSASDYEWLHQQHQQRQKRVDTKRQQPEREQLEVVALASRKKEDEDSVSVSQHQQKIPQDRQDAAPEPLATQEQQDEATIALSPLAVHHIAIVLDEIHVLDDDEFSQLPLARAMPVQVDDVPEISALQRMEDLLASETPGVQGAIIFAELSCIFVAFVAYLLHSLPLWSRFSRGQQWCLIVSFTAASLYQVAMLSWYLDLVTSDAMLGLSSLITRMISLGTVPITTTSFMGRARAACENDLQLHQLASTSSSTTGSGRNHHPRARSG